MTNLILTNYYNSGLDTQRNIFWDNNISNIMDLANSVKKYNQKLVVLTDCLDTSFNTQNLQCIKVSLTNKYNIYWECYIQAKKYVEEHEEIDFIFMTDATDVIMLNNPFPHMERGMLYFGDEYKKDMSHRWVTHKKRVMCDEIKDIEEVLNSIPKQTLLLNTGVIGGDRETFLLFLNKFCQLVESLRHVTYRDGFDTDATVGVYTAIKHFKGKYHQGNPINTKFKAFEENNQACWFKHK